MKKISRIREILHPTLKAMSSIDISTGLKLVPENRTREIILTKILQEHFHTKDQSLQVVKIQEVNTEMAKMIAKEYQNSSTLSFDIEFIDCYGLKCMDWKTNRDPIEAVVRPRITVKSGKTAGYHLVTHDGIVLVAFNLYNNFDRFATNCGLRATKKAATEYPTTHFVYHEQSTESGFTWFNTDYFSAILADAI